MKYQDYKDALKIDKDDLDNELIAQPQLLADVSEEFVRAQSRRDQANEKQKQVQAERFAVLSKESKTVKEADSKVVVDEKYIEAREQYKSAENEAAKWEYLRDAYKERGFMLRTLAQLYSTEYYQQASVYGSQRAADDAQYQTYRKQQAERRQRKGKRSTESTEDKRPTRKRRSLS